MAFGFDKFLNKVKGAFTSVVEDQEKQDDPLAVCEILDEPQVIFRADKPGELECFLYRIRKTGINGDVKESFRAYRLYRTVRVPQSITVKDTLLEETDDALTGLYRPDMDGKTRALIFMGWAANIIREVGADGRTIGPMQAGDSWGLDPQRKRLARIWRATRALGSSKSTGSGPAWLCARSIPWRPRAFST